MCSVAYRHLGVGINDSVHRKTNSFHEMSIGILQRTNYGYIHSVLQFRARSVVKREPRGWKWWYPKDTGKKLTTGSTQETQTQVTGMTDRHIYRTEHNKWLLVPGNNHKDHVAAQTVCRRPLTAEARDRFQARQSTILGGQSGTGTHFIPSTSICSSYYHYINAPDTFIHLLPHIIYHLPQGVSKAKSKIAHTLQDVCSGRKLGTPQPVARPKTKLC
jgi:hypothetical protein